VNEVHIGDVDHPIDRVSFRRFVVYLADRIGRHHIPVREDVCDIHDLLAADAVHSELIKRLIRDIYRENGCGHLDAAITAPATFNALGRTHREMSMCRFTDIDQIALINAIGTAARDLFEHAVLRHSADREQPVTADVVVISGAG